MRNQKSGDCTGALAQQWNPLVVVVPVKPTVHYDLVTQALQPANLVSERSEIRSVFVQHVSDVGVKHFAVHTASSGATLNRFNALLTEGSTAFQPYLDSTST